MWEHGDRQSLGPQDCLVIDDSPNGAAFPIPLHHVHHELSDVRNDDVRDLIQNPRRPSSPCWPVHSLGFVSFHYAVFDFGI